MKAPLMMVKRLHPGIPLPEYQTDGAAGLDLMAVFDDSNVMYYRTATDSICLPPGKQVIVGAGIAVAIPKGYVGITAPRSGRGVEGVVLGNTIGVIDSDYRGELKMCLFNRRDYELRIKRFERVVQLVIVPVAQVALLDVPELPPSERGDGGLGSTGR